MSWINCNDLHEDQSVKRLWQFYNICPRLGTEYFMNRLLLRSKLDCSQYISQRSTTLDNARHRSTSLDIARRRSTTLDNAWVLRLTLSNHFILWLNSENHIIQSFYFMHIIAVAIFSLQVFENLRRCLKNSIEFRRIKN